MSRRHFMCEESSIFKVLEVSNHLFSKNSREESISLSSLFGRI